MQLQTLHLIIITTISIVKLGDGIVNKVRLLQFEAFGLIKKICNVPLIDNLIVEVLMNTTVNMGGLKFRLADEDSFTNVSDSEQFMKNWFTPMVGETIIDVGANMGKYTMLSAKAVGERGLVISVEADPLDFQRLKENTRLNNFNNVVLCHVAAWNSDTTLRFFKGHHSGHHSLKINWRLGYFTVPARTLDSVLCELLVEKVNWIKIDVEGAEVEVLEGAKNIMHKYKPKIVVEIADNNLEKIKRLARELDYNVVRISSILKFDNYNYSRQFAYYALVA